MENHIEAFKEWFRRPEVRKGFAITGVSAIILGVLLISFFDDNGLLRMNNRNEILMPWQGEVDRGIPMPIKMVTSQTEALPQQSNR